MEKGMEVGMASDSEIGEYDIKSTVDEPSSID